MIRRSVEISREACHLAVRDEQLVVLRRGGCPEDAARRIPLEDLGVLMVDQRETTYTHSALVKLADHGAALVVCGADHLPCGMLLSLSTNTELLGRLDTQLSASKPRRKRLWSAIVGAKIRAQAENLTHAPEVRSRLLAMSRRVRSGDPDNLEAQAARAYWPALFDGVSGVPSPFRRRPGERDAPPPNNLLDYGYAALRAALGRAIVSAGLLPALGVQHRQRSNPFCLADDLIEPLRPMVDARVRMLASKGQVALDQPTKAEILRLLTDTVRVGDAAGPLGVAVVRYVASFVRVLAGEAEVLEVPVAEAASADSPSEPVEEDDDGCT